MPHTITATLTDQIIDSFLSLYVKNGKHIFLKFENYEISLAEFLAISVPHIGSFMWPFDKEEVGRVWPNLLLVTEKIGPIAMQRALPPPHTTWRSDEAPLNLELIYHTIHDDPRWPNRVVLRCLPRHVNNTLPQMPTAEVRITTVHSSWFLSNDAYMKIFRILKEYIVTRLFLMRSSYCSDLTRYDLTWFPHAHLEARRVLKRNAGSEHYIAIQTSRIWRSPVLRHDSATDLTSVVLNLRETHLNLRYTRKFIQLIRDEPPKLVIVMGITDLESTEKETMKALRYMRDMHTAADNGKANGIYIFWNPKKVTVVSVPAYNNGKHILIKVPNGKVKTGGRFKGKHVGCM